MHLQTNYASGYYNFEFIQLSELFATEPKNYIFNDEELKMRPTQELKFGEGFYREKIKLEYGDPNVIQSIFASKSQDPNNSPTFSKIFDTLKEMKGMQLTKAFSELRTNSSCKPPFSYKLLNDFIEYGCHIAIGKELDKSELKTAISTKLEKDQTKLMAAYQQLIQSIIKIAVEYTSSEMFGLLSHKELNPPNLKAQLTSFTSECLNTELLSCSNDDKRAFLIEQGADKSLVEQQGDFGSSSPQPP